ncbi:MAG: FtsX-like permease family protein [Bacteroidales bacterium]
MRLSLYIAKRYLFAKKSRNAINIISGISVAGVTVGTMALVIVLSVFNGLEEMVSRIFNTFDPEIKITATSGKVFDPDTTRVQKIRDIPGIDIISYTLEENVLLTYDERQYIATIKGVDDNYREISGVDSTMWEGSFDLYSPGGSPQAVVGLGVARYLGIRTNFIAQLQIWVPKRTGSVNLNVEEAFYRRYLSPAGIYQIEQEFDSKYVFVPLSFAREILEYDTQVSAVEIKCIPGSDVTSVKKTITGLLGNGFVIQDRYQQQEIFYKVMKSERLSIFIILTLILLIASFNIVGSLTMLIIEKKRDIGILRSLGADNSLIRKIFILEGWMISIIGAFSGVLLGFIICFLQQEFGLIRLQGESLIMDAYPVVMKLKDFVAVPVTVLLIGFWAAWYPVRFLTKKYLLANEKGNK